MVIFAHQDLIQSYGSFRLQARRYLHDSNDPSVPLSSVPKPISFFTSLDDIHIDSSFHIVYPESNSPDLGAVSVAESDSIWSFLGRALSVDAGILYEMLEVSDELPFLELLVVYLPCRNFLDPGNR